MMPPKMWTFVVRGGAEFQLKIPVHPTLDHDGTNTIWKASLEAMEAVEIRKAIESNGSSVEIFHEEEDAEQVRERNILLGKEGRAFPTESCPSCFFFDPLLEAQCGVDDWPSEMTVTAMEDPKAVLSRSQCPLEK